MTLLVEKMLTFKTWEIGTGTDYAVINTCLPGLMNSSTESWHFTYKRTCGQILLKVCDRLEDNQKCMTPLLVF
jgi:hypothetical protein